MKKQCLALVVALSLSYLGVDRLLGETGVFGESRAHLDVLSVSPEVTAVSLLDPEILIEDLTFEGDIRQVATVAGEPFLPEAGGPALPTITRLFRIPNTGGVELILHRAEFTLRDSFKPCPYDDFAREDVVLTDAWTKDEWYPNTLVEVSDPMVLRDIRVVAVSIHPVQVNPVTEQARLYDAIEFDLVANLDPAPNEVTLARAPSPRFVPIYRGLISNLDDSSLDDGASLPGGYMILAKDHQSVNPFVDSLAAWRRLCGYDVMIEQRTTWTASQMQQLIQNTYAESESPLEFVTLMGSPESSFGMPTGPQGDYDHYFALANGADDLEDIGVARLPASSMSEFATLNAKLMAYERTPDMSDSMWFQRAVLLGNTRMGLASNATFVRWADHQFQMHTGLDSNIVITYQDPFPTDTLIELMNRGIGALIWRGSWIGGMDPGFFGQPLSNRRLPLGVFGECATDGLSKAFVLAGTAASPKGGVCGIGVATAGSYAVYNQTCIAGLIYSLANLHVEHVSHALAAGKAWLFRAYGTNNYTINHSRWFMEHGDAAFALRTEIPVTIEALHPLTLPIGARSVEVQVRDSVSQAPIKDAVVVLWKGNFEEPEVYVRALSDDSGRVAVPLDISTSGELRLAVTKHNHRPYLFNIPCDTVSRHVSIESVLIDDNNAGGTQGNSDGLINPTETVDLIVQARNTGIESYTAPITATLSCENPEVEISQFTMEFPALAADEVAQGSTPFRLTLAPIVPHDVTVHLIFSFDTEDGELRVVHDVLCHAPLVCPESQAIELQEFVPGATADFSAWVENCGEVSIVNPQAQLISTNPFIEVLQGLSDYTDAIPGQSSGPLSLFRIQADSAAFRGQEASLLLAFLDSTGFRDTVALTLTIGDATELDPTGPDAYGYYAFDSRDTSYASCPQFDYLDISEGLGTDLELEDTGESVSPNEIWSTVVALPFTFRYYGADFDTITVCSNGWLAFGDQSWSDCFRNYPIPGILSVPNMVAAYWDDLKTSGAGQGVWVYHDDVHQRLIVQWKASSGGPGYNQANLDFEAVLLNPAAFPTRDGNGKMQFQYDDVTLHLSGTDPHDTPGCTIGIQDSTSTVGLQYLYGFEYANGASILMDGSAILFTTDGPIPPDTTSGAPPRREIPESTWLHPSYPNPFNPRTTIRFDLSSDTQANLAIYDVGGRLVDVLLDGMMTAGQHEVQFDGSKCSSGVYFCRLQADAHTFTQKVILLK